MAARQPRLTFCFASKLPTPLSKSFPGRPDQRTLLLDAKLESQTLSPQLQWRVQVLICKEVSQLLPGSRFEVLSDELPALPTPARKQTTPQQAAIRDASVPCGPLSLANTCYISVALQCILHVASHSAGLRRKSGNYCS